MVKKGVKKENIKIITSHPQPIGQCSKLLSHEFADVKIEFADSTASAAKRVKESDGSVACIGSPNSAKIYDLDILCHDCGDDANNSTRFVIIEKTPNKTVTGHDKSSIVFAIDNKPGSLYSAIELLAKSGINMTKIESRPMKKELGKYVFFIDIDGNIDDVMSPNPVDQKFAAFGWHVQVIDGHDFQQIADAVAAAKAEQGKPSVIIAKTVKGKGVSYMENQAGWHGSAPSEEQVAQAMSELN